MGNALLPLSMLFPVLHLKHPASSEKVINRAFDVIAGRAVYISECVDVGEGELIGTDSHNSTILLVKIVKGSCSVAGEIDKQQPLISNLAKERSGNMTERAQIYVVDDLRARLLMNESRRRRARCCLLSRNNK